LYFSQHPDAPQEKATITFDVRLVGHETPQLMIEEGDFIGMESLETLLADFLIINYSNKGKKQQAVGEMGNGSYQISKDCEGIIDKWKGTFQPTNDKEKEFFDVVLIPWFSNKFEAFMSHIPKLEQLSIKHPQNLNVDAKSQEIEEIKQFLPSAAAILTHYFQLYGEKTEMGRKGPQASFEYKTENRVGGYYSHQKNEIVINLALVSLHSIFELGKKISKYKPLLHHSLISGIYQGSGILNHELEHARRGASCGDASMHARGMDANGKYVDFDSCAASYARKGYQRGLFLEWAQKLQTLTLPSKEALARLQEIEKNNPACIAEAVKHNDRQQSGQT
jgi:hypothetical protein